MTAVMYALHFVCLHAKCSTVYCMAFFMYCLCGPWWIAKGPPRNRCQVEAQAVLFREYEKW